jgi:hypothetical protein
MIRRPEQGPSAGGSEIDSQFATSSAGMIVPNPISSRGEKFFLNGDVKMI